MHANKTYVGILDDQFGGMTPTGAIVKDAWIFGLIPETETCAGWSVADIQVLYDKVNDLWAQYGFLVANLPDTLRERHERIHREAIERARARGWEPEMYESE